MRVRQLFIGITILIISSLFVGIGIGIGIGIGYELQPTHQTQPTHHIQLSFASPTPTATPDDGFKEFLVGFTQAVQYNDWSTIASDTDQANFTATGNGVDWLYRAFNVSDSNASWSTIYIDLQDQILIIKVQSPPIYTCSSSMGYRTKAVMGTFTLDAINTANQELEHPVHTGGSGYAAFEFYQPEQNATWQWLGLKLNVSQCSQNLIARHPFPFLSSDTYSSW